MPEYRRVTFVLFGLTGGLASGKSTVAARFRARGVPVIDADQLARDVVAPGAPALSEIARAFGAELVRTDGTLDRKALAARAFASPADLRTLEAITHPRIAAAAREQARVLEARGEALSCYEAALLVERGLADQYRPLVVVAADRALQVSRARARDGLEADDAEARIAAQLPLASKIAVADYVIMNDGDIDELGLRADAVLAAICARAGVDEARYALVPGGVSLR
jgi:dephospho-CoA kinase